MVDGRIMAGVFAGGLALASGVSAQTSATLAVLDACNSVMERSSPAPLADWSSREDESSLLACGIASSCLVYTAPDQPDVELYVGWDFPLANGVFTRGVVCKNFADGQLALPEDRVVMPLDVSAWLERAENSGRLFQFEERSPTELSASGCGANGWEYQLHVQGRQFLFVQSPSFPPCGATS